MASIKAKRNSKPTNGWPERHDAALLAPRFGSGEVVGQMIKSWGLYADDYRQMYNADGGGSMLGDDYVLGVAWQEIGEQLRVLLNGTCGRLDCGTLDGFILDTLRENGIDTDKL